MGEIRKDYLLDFFVIVSPERGKRPQDFHVKKTTSDEAKCPFCLHNRPHELPDELQRWDLPDEPGGLLLTHNKYPIVRQEGRAELQTHNKFYTFGSNYGEHVVLLEGAKHGIHFGSMSEEAMAKVLLAYQDVLDRLYSSGSRYVTLFKNEGEASGASIDHPHTQMLGLGITPHSVMHRYEAFLDYKGDHGTCPYCEIMARERGSTRGVISEHGWTIFCPYASKNPYELVFFPDRHVSRYRDLSEEELTALAGHLKTVLEKLATINAPYNLELISSNGEADFHCHFVLSPRLTLLGGFEFTTDIIVNPVTPESAAEFYRS